jgi:membrane associated rhomboid family serine protease
MRPVVLYRGSVYLFGVRFEGPAAALAALTLVLSILSALVPPLRSALVLTPESLFAGEIWRIATWFLVALDPLSLVFGVLGVLFFGNDLCRSMGNKAFLRLALGIPVVAGLLICGVVQLLPPVFSSLQVAGNWALVDTLIIAWATLFPQRQLFVYFVLPLSGRTLIIATIGITLLFALYQGPLLYLPLFLTQVLTLAYLHHGSLAWWLRSRFRRRPTPRRSHLRAVPRNDIEDPPRWVH